MTLVLSELIAALSRGDPFPALTRARELNAYDS